jgi:GGDEF domain-containing protein
VLQRTAPAGSDLARIGGDEFALLVSGAREEAVAACAAVEAALGDLHVSFGWSLFPSDGVGPVELFRKADDRLYAAKLVRRNRAVVSVAAT